MHESAGLHVGSLVTFDDTLEREFEERMREASPLAVRVAYSVLRQPHDAEDVAQEAFARAYRRFTRLRHADQFRAWLVRTTWRLALDRWRSNRRRRIREFAVAVQTQAPPVEDQVVANERADRLWHAIDELPPKLRLVIVLYRIEGHDVAAVARLLGIPEGTVKSRLFLARKALARSLRCLA